jgi:hypothetical protein
MAVDERKRGRVEKRRREGGREERERIAKCERCVCVCVFC